MTKKIVFFWLAQLTLLTAWIFPISVSAQEIWYGPSDNIPRRGRVLSADYMRLFEPNAPWQNAASHVSVFIISPLFASNASDDDLRKIFTFLQKHKIRLALELGMVERTPTECGGGEGSTNPATASLLANRIKRLGGDLSYIDMDEPLFFGHQYAKGNACQYSIDEVAARVARTVKHITDVFPDVVFGGAEPIGDGLQPAAAVSDFEKWFGAFHQATGRRIEFVHMDVDWNSKWLPYARRLQALCQRAKVRLGVIYIGNGKSDHTDADAIQSTEQNVKLFEATMGAQSDQVVIKNWLPNPSHVLPESSPTAHTHLINWYFDRSRYGQAQ